MGINHIIYWKTSSIYKKIPKFQNHPWVMSLNQTITITTVYQTHNNNNYPKHITITININKSKQDKHCFWLLPFKSCFSKTSPPFWPEWPKGQCSWCVVILTNFAERTSSWSYMAAILLDYSVWTSLSPSSLPRMIWNASGGITEEVDALVLLPLLPVLKLMPDLLPLPQSPLGHTHLHHLEDKHLSSWRFACLWLKA